MEPNTPVLMGAESAGLFARMLASWFYQPASRITY